jgi:hypothetical protein
MEDGFGDDARNVRLGMSTDGLNSFGNQSSTHSTWPIFLWPYNLPPWLCTKQRYVHMSILIQGPKQPGIDMHLYLKLLKEELATLWETSVRTWDTHKGEYFGLRAMLLTMVQDYPGYTYVSCQVAHEHNACVRCMDKMSHVQLPKDPGSSKTVFPGIRKWLPADHPWRKRGDLFNGSEKLKTSPPIYNGEDINDLLEEWEACPAPGKKRSRVKPLRGVWKARSIFWELPYWKYLHMPHSLDLIHITKNVCESLVATIVNMTEKTKDGPKARNDLIKLGIRKELHVGCPDDANDVET